MLFYSPPLGGMAFGLEEIRISGLGRGSEGKLVVPATSPWSATNILHGRSSTTESCMVTSLTRREWGLLP